MKQRLKAKELIAKIFPPLFSLSIFASLFWIEKRERHDLEIVFRTVAQCCYSKARNILKLKKYFKNPKIGSKRKL
jgi:hypothetical protein